ncbi:uncharacterized protein LOC114799761 [Denticeps clupeoides]|uniref:SH2 domain-containing protein n=1 Tax=Denticeps clupeoides TaxID=299321 RepID=A0AAY4B9Y6_9TELE|nr:uncharacterized protein LOC114799761 [Denticeps clupeoides]
MMDFDNQMMKDAEEQMGLTPLPMPCILANPEHTNKPPVKPRRSIKCRPTAQQRTQTPNPAAKPNTLEMEVTQLSVESLPSSLQVQTLLWFQRSQLPQLHTHTHTLPSWLHGFTTRREAEQMLKDHPLGSFLLRLSESKIGFVLSYRGEDRCRHFIIEQEEDGRYLITGEDIRHSTLDELITYYTHNPVGPFNEKLTVPCGESTVFSNGNASLGGRDSRDGQKGLGLDPAPPINKVIPVLMQAPGSTQVLTATATADYAVVKKVLKTSLSLTESQQTAETRSPSVEVLNPGASILKVGSSGAASTLDTELTDAPYARVNKPPRSTPHTAPAPFATTTVTSSDQQSMDHAAPSSLRSSAEQKYWQLEPLHTYEEMLFTASRQEADFYAIGRRREVEGVRGDSTGHHLYSEINLRGSRHTPSCAPESLPVMNTLNQTRPASARFTSNLPFQPPPRYACGYPRDLSMQSSVPLQNPHWQHSTTYDPSGIYEQIPERSRVRPPLPSHNPKH